MEAGPGPVRIAIKECGARSEGSPFITSTHRWPGRASAGAKGHSKSLDDPRASSDGSPAREMVSLRRERRSLVGVAVD